MNKNISIDQSKKYGILLSGGIDSAILLYLLLKDNNNINIQPFTIPKFDGAIKHAKIVIKHFNEKFNLKIPETIGIGDPTIYHRLQSKTAVEEIFKKYPVDFLFIGINQNPPELNDLPGAPLRSKKSDNPKIILPFVDLLKTDILEFMFKYHQDDLADITHSCTEQNEGRCEVCWQCRERKWAFSKLNKKDTGTR